MRHLDVLQLDDCYSSLHALNYRRCTSEVERERYRKQFCNLLTRRNTRIHQEICQYQSQFQSFRARRQPTTHVTRSRNSSIGRAIVLLKSNPPIVSHSPEATARLTTEPFKQPSAVNISWEQLAMSKETNFSKQCSSLQRCLAEKRSQIIERERESRHSTMGQAMSSTSEQTLAMVGMRMHNSSKREPLADRIASKILPEEQELLYNPEEKENSKGLPGIFRPREVRLSNKNSLALK